MEVLNNRKKILVIDDEEDFSYFVKKSLEAISNYKIITASKGKNGIQIARKEKPDLILLDIMIPGMEPMTILAMWVRREISELTRAILVLSIWTIVLI